MKQMSAIALVVFVLFASACAGTPPGNGGYYDPATQGTAGARQVEDSRATIGAATAVAWDATAQAQNVFAQETATAEVAAVQTAAVYQAAMADLDIVERQAQLTATYQSYQIELEMTRAVGTRIASDMQAQERLTASQINALATEQAVAVDRARLTNTFLNGFMLFGVVLASVVTIFVLAWFTVYIYGFLLEKKAPVLKVQFEEGTQMFHRKNGGLQPVGQPRLPGVVTIDQPRLAEVSESTPAKWDSFMAWNKFDTSLPLGAIISDTNGRRRPLELNPVTDAYLLIGGTNGSGKTIGGLIPYILGMWAGGAHVIVFNWKGADFHALQGLPNITFFPKVADPVDLLEPLGTFFKYLEIEGQRRDRVLERYQAENWRQLPPGVDNGPIVVAIDELLFIILGINKRIAAIQADIRLTNDQRRQAIAQWNSLVTNLWAGMNGATSVFRKYGIHIVATVTDPSRNNAFGDEAMLFRGQCAAMGFTMRSAISRSFLDAGKSDGFPMGSSGFPAGHFLINGKSTGEIVRSVAFYPKAPDIQRFSHLKLPTIRPFNLSRDIEDGLGESARLIGTPSSSTSIILPPPSYDDDDAVSGVFYDKDTIDDAQILIDSGEEFSSATGAANIIFRARGVLGADVGANSTWHIPRARKALIYLATELGNARAASIVGD